MPLRFVDYLLRAAVAFAFLYPPLNALTTPYNWIGYFPAFTRGFVDEMVLLHAFGALEVVLALWILSGWRIFYPSVAAALALGAIVALNLSEFPVLFRDIPIAFAAVALALLHLPERWQSGTIRGAVPINR
jgi:hypothetical protein